MTEGIGGALQVLEMEDVVVDVDDVDANGGGEVEEVEDEGDGDEEGRDGALGEKAVEDFGKGREGDGTAVGEGRGGGISGHAYWCRESHSPGRRNSAYREMADLSALGRRPSP